MIFIVFGLLAGFGLPIQTAINTRLKGGVRSPFIASTISFGVGTLFLIFLALVTRPAITPLNLATTPWWLWLGGFLGAIYLTGNVLLLPRIGSFQTVLMPIIGQVLMSMVIDNFGLFYSKHIPMSLLRLVGAMFVVLGAWLIVYVPARKGNFKTPAAAAKGLWLWRLLGLTTGALSASQTAINGHLGVMLGAPLIASIISFAVGLVVLCLVVLGFNFKILRQLKAVDLKALPWWAWIGGAIGSMFVFGNILIVPSLGTGLAIVIVLAGQLLGSLVLEKYGFLNVAKHVIQRNAWIGLAIILLGICLVKFF
ncbi:hypothetical protein FC83_GL000069 [Agrilactobacillus composti DSM 18527 = JCM 14202]|uniref:Integral membrane protein n=1 Tax=Agrilactobacillus composti DSM 18527 = JCM 14202 TaxID=1423734 RepID=A0A0R1XW89_9LACO|nr:DMT family transporter [Agrilactobacillus composti]KRM32980.1 hypothetical protein FC83_GL000069 [Agrilactobacillus composti DSM 18527 = JCM 14202]